MQTNEASFRDPYRRRREAGVASREETRRRLLVSADGLFRERGYRATTVAAIAEGAGVSLQTLYLAWGSKRALLNAAAGAAAMALELPLQPDEWRATIRAELAEDAGEDTAGAYLAAVGRLFVSVAGRTAPYWRVYRQAAATDPEVAADWEGLMADRRRTMDEVAKGVPRRGLRDGLEEGDVADTLWALASPEVYELFVVQGGRSPAAYGAWLERTLVVALCVAPGQPPSTAPTVR